MTSAGRDSSMVTVIDIAESAVVSIADYNQSLIRPGCLSIGVRYSGFRSRKIGSISVRVRETSCEMMADLHQGEIRVATHAECDLYFC
jgi:hypothetical protein